MTPSAEASGPTRVDVLGVGIDRLDLEETVSRCVELVERGEPAQHVCVNAAVLALLREQPRLREIYERAAIVNADGQSIVWAARLLGNGLPERVAAPDLLDRLLSVAAERGYRVFILGAEPATLERAISELRLKHPGLVIAGHHHGYFAETDSERVCAEVRAARPQLVVVAMTSPKKDYWIDEHFRHYGAPLSLGVGGAIDILAKEIRRAPVPLQRAGLEWLFRLVQEPRRLGRRYLVTNTSFLALLLRELVTTRRSRATR